MSLRNLRRLPAVMSAAALSAAAAAVLLAGCASSAPVTPAAPSSSPDGASRAPAAGRPAAAGQLTDRLVLKRTRVVAGQPIRAALIVTNSGRASVSLNHRCRPQYTVVLTNRRFPPDVSLASICSLRPLILRPGENRLAVTIVTTFQSCTRTASQATRLMPVCQHGRQIMPPLPAGRYRAVLQGSGLSVPAPRPVPVILAAQR